MFKKSRKLKQIREAVAKGGGIWNACKSVGISPVTLYMWRKKDKRINRYVEALMEHRVSLVEDALYKGAINGNTVAQIFFLKNRSRGKWRDHHEIDNNHKFEKVNVTVSVNDRKDITDTNRIAQYATTGLELEEEV